MLARSGELHIPRGSQTTTAHCTNHRSVSGYTPQTWSSRVLLIVAGGGNIGTLLHGCHTSNAREMTCRCWCWILHLTRAPLSSTRCPQPAEQSSSAVFIAKMLSVWPRWPRCEPDRGSSRAVAGRDTAETWGLASEVIQL